MKKMMAQMKLRKLNKLILTMNSSLRIALRILSKTLIRMTIRGTKKRKMKMMISSKSMMKWNSKKTKVTIKMRMRMISRNLSRASRCYLRTVHPPTKRACRSRMRTWSRSSHLRRN